MNGKIAVLGPGRKPAVEIVEYINGEYTRTHCGIKSAAVAWRTSDEAIKNCVASGLPLNYSGIDSVTFDMPADSPYYYDFIVLPDGTTKAVLFVDN